MFIHIATKLDRLKLDKTGRDQWRIQKFWKRGRGGRQNVSTPSSFIANAHKELHTPFIRGNSTCWKKC